MTITETAGYIQYYEADINPDLHTFESCFNKAMLNFNNHRIESLRYDKLRPDGDHLFLRIILKAMTANDHYHKTYTATNTDNFYTTTMSDTGNYKKEITPNTTKDHVREFLTGLGQVYTGGLGSLATAIASLPLALFLALVFGWMFRQVWQVFLLGWN